MSTPLISIIVPCYNQAQYLDEALQSIFDQTYSNWECIIINDGSSDSTKELAEKWLSKDKRYTYYFQENLGVSAARNLGVELSKGDFIQFLDSDDILDSNKIQLSINLATNRNSDIIITNFKTFSDSIEQAREHPGFLNPEFLNFKGILYEWGYYFNIPIHCGLFPASFFQNFKFSTELKGNEDWIMWISFFKKYSVVRFIDKPLVYYRSHKESVTKNSEVMNDSYIKAINYIRTLISVEEYVQFLLHIISKKENEVNRLQQKVNTFKNSTTSKILEKTNKLLVGKMIIKYSLMLFKKEIK